MRNNRNLFIMLLVFITAMFNVYAKQGNIFKSPNDSRVYETFTLDNGMEVLLASDPNLTQVAASLTVGVGQYQDPNTQQGLAHYLEHMIFMGSARFPEPNALRQLVETNNGVLNAITAAQQTSYYFSIASEQFDIALNILSAAIHAPLLKQEFATKELKAVDAEWQLQQQNSTFSVSRVNAMTASAKHPMRKMGLGNLTTLKDKKNSVLKEELQLFHQRYYSSNIMKLALVGNQSLKELKALAVKYFERIENKQIKRPLTSEDFFSNEHFKKHIFVKTSDKNYTLGLQFPLENNTEQWVNKPNAFVSYLLTSEASGSLISSLREAGLIESMQAIFNSSAYGQNGAAFISFTLTDKGEKNQHKIISAFFKYINLIKKQGVNTKYAEEFKSILSNQFNSVHEPSALTLATTFSIQMLNMPVAEVLRYSTLFSTFDEKPIHRVLEQLNPTKMRLWHLGEYYDTNIQLEFAINSYREKGITAEEFKLWRDTDMVLKLPDVIEIENVDNFKSVAKTLDKPKRIIKEEGVQGWLMHSKYFDNKKGQTGVVLQSPLYQKDVKHHVMINVLLILLNADLQHIIQEASQRHQVYLSGNQNKNGDLTFNISGITKHHPEYLNQVLTLLKEIEFNQQDFDQALKIYGGMTKSIKNAALPQQAAYYTNILLTLPPFIWNSEQKMTAIKSLSLNDLKHFQQALAANIYVDLFAFGNYSEADALRMAKESRAVFGQKKLSEKPVHKAEFKPAAYAGWNERKLVSQDHVMLKDTFIYPEASLKVSIQLYILNKLISAPFFKELRTNRQLGYDIGSYREYILQYPALTLYIQSSNTDLKTLEEHFIDFIDQFAVDLAAMDESIINQTKNSIINSMQQKPENIYTESDQYFYDWNDEKYEFDSFDKKVSILQTTSKQDLLTLYKSMLIDGYSTNILIQLQGKKFMNTPFFYWDFELEE
ncbi:MAG: protease-3 [Alteromonadaceae bacterium]|jgi:protease-3